MLRSFNFQNFYYKMFSSFTLVLIGCFVSLTFDLSDGFCLQGPLITERTAFNRTRQYCAYKHEGATINLLLGSTIHTADCIHCSCSASGMSCCGFGHKAGVFSVGADCVMIPDGCQPIFVKANNHSLDCFTGKPVKIADTSIPLRHPDNEFSLKASNQNMRGIATGSTHQTKPVRNRIEEVMRTLQNTKLAQNYPFQAELMSQMIAQQQQQHQPFWQDVAMQHQHVPDMTSSHQASVSYHNDGTTQDAGWFPWMFMMT